MSLFENVMVVNGDFVCVIMGDECGPAKWRLDLVVTQNCTLINMWEQEVIVSLLDYITLIVNNDYLNFFTPTDLIRFENE